MSALPKRVRFVAACLIGAATSFAVSAAPLAPEQIQKIDQLVATYMTAHQVPGLSIAVVSEGELVWSQGYGVADLENNIPAKATTVYRTASIGKTMTATAAMQLVEAGKLKLDQLITKRYSIDEAPQAFEDMQTGKNARGVIVF